MIQPKFCFTNAGYRRQVEKFEDGDLYDCIMNYRDNLGPIGNFLAMYGLPPRWVEEFSDVLFERENARNQIPSTRSLEEIPASLSR